MRWAQNGDFTSVVLLIFRHAAASHVQNVPTYLFIYFGEVTPATEIQRWPHSLTSNKNFLQEYGLNLEFKSIWTVDSIMLWRVSIGVLSTCSYAYFVFLEALCWRVQVQGDAAGQQLQRLRVFCLQGLLCGPQPARAAAARRQGQHRRHRHPLPPSVVTDPADTDVCTCPIFFIFFSSR